MASYNNRRGGGNNPDRGGNNWNKNNPPKVRQGQQGLSRNIYLQANSSGNWRERPAATQIQAPKIVEYCSSALVKCEDPACLKRHPESTLEVSLRNNRRLNAEMRDNILKALRRLDNELWKTRKSYIEEQQKAVQFEELQKMRVKIFELLSQRHAFCERVYETLQLQPSLLTRYQLNSIIWRDLYRLNSRLPAFAKRLELESAIRKNDIVMVVGATGSGKSTQIPQYLNDMPEFFGRKVYCTQPRRVATMSLAERVAFEFAGGYEPGAKVGNLVGFQIGGLSKRSRRTRIEYMTEGMLIQHLAEKFSVEADNKKNKTDQQNVKERITLRHCSAVVVDEVHERSILSDFLLGLLKDKQKSLPGLKIIVSSATIDNEKFSKYLGGCPIVEIPGKAFPVEMFYEPKLSILDLIAGFNRKSLLDHLVNAAVSKVLEIVKTTSQGHILCFLTGQFEVEKACQFLMTNLRGDREKLAETVIFPLFGKQTPDEQQNVVRPLKDPKLRKVVFATDVAETSLTVDGVRFVVDCGYAKEAVFDSERNVTTLRVFKISKSSADQRAGRAGRTGPGICYRLYDKEFYQKMEPFPKPEIQRRSMALTVTTLIAIGKNPYEFDWIDPPEARAIKAAEKELRYLRIIGEGPIENAGVTDVGRAICSLQIEPGLGRMIYYACKDGYGQAAAAIAGLLTSGFQLFPNCKTPSMRSKFISKHGDVVSAYRAFREWLALKELDDKEKEAENAKNGIAPKKVEEDVSSSDDESLAEPNEKGNEGGEEIIPDGEPVANQAKTGVVAPDEMDVDENVEIEQGIDMVAPEEIVLDLTLDEELAEDSMPTSQRIQDWARVNFVSSDACYMAYLEMNSLVHRLKARSFWKMAEKQDREPNDDQIKKMVLNAMAMNVAKVFSPANWQYRALATETYGQVTDKSPLRQVTTEKPVWIVFFEGSGDATRPYFSNVTPIEPSWILDGSITLSGEFRQLIQKNI